MKSKCTPLAVVAAEVLHEVNVWARGLTQDLDFGILNLPKVLQLKDKGFVLLI